MQRKLTKRSHVSRGVSPVIGVVMMVAVTIVLAAVIGTFVFGMTPDEHRTATATISIEGSVGANNVSLTHLGGEPLELTDYAVLADGSLSQGNQTMTGTLAAGERLIVREVGASKSTRVTLRHDPSGEVVADTTVDIE